jgi:crossover junction endodeoxyribonuclease RuvC
VALALGIDPGFASLGYALVDVSVSEVVVGSLGVITTEKSNKKQNVLASSDNLRRARELARLLQPLVQEAGVICVEAMSFPRNASAAAKVAMSWGVLACLSELSDVPIVQVSPKELKQAVCGDATASKEKVAEALDRRFARSFGAELVGRGVAKSLHEHAYDALGTVVASLSSEVLRALRRSR